MVEKIGFSFTLFRESVFYEILKRDFFFPDFSMMMIMHTRETNLAVNYYFEGCEGNVSAD